MLGPPITDTYMNISCIISYTSSNATAKKKTLNQIKSFLLLPFRKLSTSTVASWWRPCHCLPTLIPTLWPPCWPNWDLKSFSRETTSSGRAPLARRCTSSSMGWSASWPKETLAWNWWTDPTLEVCHCLCDSRVISYFSFLLYSGLICLFQFHYSLPLNSILFYSVFLFQYGLFCFFSCFQASIV